MMYYYQLRAKAGVPFPSDDFPMKPWPMIIARGHQFETVKEARTFARQLASLFKIEVRLSDNARLHGGEYFQTL